MKSMENTQKTDGKDQHAGERVTETHREFMQNRIQKLFCKLNDSDQHNIYSLVWSLTAKDLIYKLAKDREEEYKQNLEVYY